ncbi:hypothetical protein OIDMADRAFT_30158 [Oidiodendron maius Zn]|uniref:Uncharacterized protein n=1 Tax=Oidiodendron maius (strain Zn) TaxID=913774 RepID=A0A0C3HBM5_OIDMZ|nr:hypothetical protein OIDMADRAFT_30158 [Oidiodendron maius Zn]
MSPRDDLEVNDMVDIGFVMDWPVQGIKLLLDPDQPHQFYLPESTAKADLKRLDKPALDVVTDYIGAIYPYMQCILPVHYALHIPLFNHMNIWFQGLQGVIQPQFGGFSAENLGKVEQCTLHRSLDEGAVDYIPVMQYLGLREGDWPQLAAMVFDLLAIPAMDSQARHFGTRNALRIGRTEEQPR